MLVQQDSLTCSYFKWFSYTFCMPIDYVLLAMTIASGCAYLRGHFDWISIWIGNKPIALPTHLMVLYIELVSHTWLART